MTDTALAGTMSGTTTKQKAGLVLCALSSLANIPSVLEQQPSGQEGPPTAILVVDTVLGVVGLAAAIAAWRGNRVALRVAAGAIILATLTGLPAFFVDVPTFVKAVVAASVVLTVVTVVLMFSGDRRPATVIDSGGRP